METSISLSLTPLSVNRAWRGRRFKTPEYNRYERDVALLTPRPQFTWNEPVSITYIFNLRRHRSFDADNPVKPLQDILVKLGYLADDNLVYHYEVFKVPATDDLIEIVIRPLSEAIKE